MGTKQGKLSILTSTIKENCTQVLCFVLKLSIDTTQQILGFSPLI